MRSLNLRAESQTWNTTKCAYLVIRQELCQVLLAWLHKHSQVAAVDDFYVQLGCCLDQVFELRVQLWCPTGDIKSFNRWRCLQELDTPLCCSAIHHLSTLWRRLDVAVCAGLVAVQPDIELQNGCL